MNLPVARLQAFLALDLLAVAAGARAARCQRPEPAGHVVASATQQTHFQAWYVEVRLAATRLGAIAQTGCK